jgi:hypothetical protein
MDGVSAAPRIIRRQGDDADGAAYPIIRQAMIPISTMPRPSLGLR